MYPSGGWRLQGDSTSSSAYSTATLAWEYEYTYKNGKNTEWKGITLGEMQRNGAAGMAASGNEEGVTEYDAHTMRTAALTATEAIVFSSLT